MLWTLLWTLSVCCQLVFVLEHESTCTWNLNRLCECVYVSHLSSLNPTELLTHFLSHSCWRWWSKKYVVCFKWGEVLWDYIYISPLGEVFLNFRGLTMKLLWMYRRPHQLVPTSWGCRIMFREQWCLSNEKISLANKSLQKTLEHKWIHTVLMI